mgnify:FL=1
MNKKLLPCPFCGGDAESLEIFPHVLVRCKYCGANTGLCSRLTDAIDYWNTRSHPLDAIEDVVFLSELWDYIKFCRNASTRDIRQIHDRARDIIAECKRLYEKQKQDKSIGSEYNPTSRN